MQNGTITRWIVFAFEDSGGSNPGKPVTSDSANITAEISKDGAAPASLTDTNPTEIGDGFYAFDISATESDADLLLLVPSSSTANVSVIPCPAAIYTTPENFNVLGIESDGDLTKVNELHGQTAQSGDSYARLGAPNGASVSADIAAVDGNVDTLSTNVPEVLSLANIKTQVTSSISDNNVLTTSSFSADGSGLTAIPWNSAWDAEVQSEVADALEAIHLDHLFAVDYDADSPPGVATSLLNEITESDAGETRFTANALELGPSGGGDGSTLTNIPWNSDWDAEVQSEVQDAIEANHLDHLLAVEYDPASQPGVATALLNELIESDAGVSRFTANALEQAPAGGGDGSGFNAIPWNSAWDAQVQSEVADALAAYNAVATTDLPSNFSSLVISVGGAVDALVQGFLNNTIAESTADNIASNFETFWDNADAATTKTVDDVGEGPAVVLPPYSEPTSSTITIRAGDDYSGARAQTINISSASDLSGLNVIVAVEDDTNSYAWRFPIAGSAGSHTFDFDLPQSITKDIPPNTYDMVIRIEHATNQTQTVEVGSLLVLPFATAEPIVDV